MAEEKGKVGAPPKYDLDAEAVDLEIWMMRDDALRLYGFTATKGYRTDELNDFAKRNPRFSLALKKAKEMLALRREQKASQGEFNQYVYSVTKHIYDSELNEMDDTLYKKKLQRDLDKEKKKIEHEAKVKASHEQNKGIPTNDDDLKTLIKDLHALKSKTNSELPRSE